MAKFLNGHGYPEVASVYTELVPQGSVVQVQEGLRFVYDLIVSMDTSTGRLISGSHRQISHPVWQSSRKWTSGNDPKETGHEQLSERLR